MGKIPDGFHRKEDMRDTLNRIELAEELLSSLKAHLVSVCDHPDLEITGISIDGWVIEKCNTCGISRHRKGVVIDG